MCAEAPVASLLPPTSPALSPAGSVAAVRTHWGYLQTPVPHGFLCCPKFEARQGAGIPLTIIPRFRQ